MDRYSGWLGTIAARHEEDGEISPSVSLLESGHRLAAVAGTSTCHLVQVHDQHQLLVCPQVDLLCRHRARKEFLLKEFGVHTKQAFLAESFPTFLQSDKHPGCRVSWLVDE
jgi:hypothetical protein